MATVSPVVVSGARHVAKAGSDVLAIPVIGQSGGQTTTSTSEVSLVTITLPGGTLAADHQMVRITLQGDCTGATGTGTPRIKFGATYLDNNILYTQTNWMMEYLVRRTGAATQKAEGYQVATAGTPTILVTTPGETLSGDVTIDFRGSAGVTSTLAFHLLLVEYLAT